MVKNNQMAIPESAEVAACLKRTENKIDKLSQKATYTMLSTRNEITLKNSSGVGGIPMVESPSPMTSNPSAKNMTLITINAARNLALMI